MAERPKIGPNTQVSLEATRCSRGHDLSVCLMYVSNHGRKTPVCGECRRAVNRRYTREKRVAAIASLGGKCQCCGEATYEFLHLDHIDRDGAVHRNGAALNMRMVEREPWRFQILCANCNMAKGFYGHCPHVYREWT